MNPAGFAVYVQGEREELAIIRDNKGVDLSTNHGWILDLLVWDGEKWYEVNDVRMKNQDRPKGYRA